MQLRNIRTVYSYSSTFHALGFTKIRRKDKGSLARPEKSEKLCMQLAVGQMQLTSYHNDSITSYNDLVLIWFYRQIKVAAS